MKRVSLILTALLMLLSGVPGPRADEPGIPQLTDELRGVVETRERSAEELQAAYVYALAALVPQLASAVPAEQNAALQSIQEIAYRAGRPGAEGEREALCLAMTAFLDSDTSQTARLWLLRYLERLGRGEVVEDVAALLRDPDRLIRQAALRALQANPDPAATEKLLAALAPIAAPEWRVALIGALGSRRDHGAVPAVAKFLRHADADVAIAAAAALGSIGGFSAAAALDGARDDLSGPARRVLDDSLILCAGRLAAGGEVETGTALLGRLMAASEPARVRVAALRALSLAQGDPALPTVLRALKDRDPQVQAMAARLAFEMPGEKVAPAFAGRLRDASPPTQALVLRALADRGDAAALPGVLAAAGSKEQSVRVAAFDALSVLGDASAAPLLIQAALGKAGPDQQAARAALVRLRDPLTDARVVGALKAAAPEARVELIGVLSERLARGQVAALVALAGADPDADVRAEALDALGALATARDLPALVTLLTTLQDDKARQAAEKTLLAAAATTADPETRAAPVLGALPGATGGVRLSLLRVLGKSGSPRALDALRAALKDPSPEAQDAAVGGLCEWPDAAVADDLLAIARSDAAPERRSQAFRGYVRVVGTVSDRPAEESLRVYQEALALAPVPDDRRAVIAGLGDVPLIEALRVVQPFLDDPALREDAAAAVVKIAGPVSGASRSEVVPVLEKALEVAWDNNVRRGAEDLLDKISQHDDYILEWMAAGPYLEEGKDGQALHDIAFAPEEASAAGAKWFPVSCGTDKRWPWGVDLNATPMAGEDRVAYLRAEVWSPTAQDVRLDIGSDDGLKAWVNGKLVHANNVSRGLQPGQDKVDATLAEGWNVILLKITNRGTQWAACARIRSRDGRKLPELKSRAR